MILLGYVFPKLNKVFSNRVSRYINKAGSTNMILVKNEVELENYALLIKGFCFVQGINFPYLTFISFIFYMKFIIYMNLHSGSLSFLRGCFMLCGYNQAFKLLMCV